MDKIREVIVVEGKYDKNTLSQIVDTEIIETSGFAIRNNKDLLQMLRRIAEVKGLIILTDSDAAGFMIRNFLKSAIDKKYLKHAYIPDVFGKEKRKDTPGKEGKLGVEGMSKNIILQSLRNAGATFIDAAEKNETHPITKQDLYDLGLSGHTNSSIKRQLLLKHLELPERMSTNAMLDALKILYSKEMLIEIINTLNGEQ